MIVFVANKNEWKRQDLYDEVSTIRNAYLSLSSNLFTNLFALSVWPFWPYYSPNYNDELTAITFDLKSYLANQVE